MDIIKIYYKDTNAIDKVVFPNKQAKQQYLESIKDDENIKKIH